MVKIESIPIYCSLSDKDHAVDNVEIVKILGDKVRLKLGCDHFNLWLDP